MMNREIYLKDISENLAILSTEVSNLNAINFYDTNIVAEDFFSGLLNLIYGYELKNANHLEKNAPAIDLIDLENRVAVQVTSNNDSEKIKHTIDEFNKNKVYQLCDRLIIMILTKKKKYSTNFDTNGMFIFEKTRDIFDVEDLLKDIKKLSTERIKEISRYLSEEFRDKYDIVKKTQANEVETIIDLIVYLSKHRKVNENHETKVDPEYKIYKRFRNFAERLTTEYKTLYTIYGESLNIVNERLGIDEAQNIIIMFYLQDISVQFLEEENDDPIAALNKLVTYFEEKLSSNGKRYDRAAIKFYLVNEMIECNVFPNERSEYDVSK